MFAWIAYRRGDGMSNRCVKCGKCCTDCRTVEDLQFVKTARKLLLLSESCSDLQEFRGKLREEMSRMEDVNRRRYEREVSWLGL